MSRLTLSSKPVQQGHAAALTLVCNLCRTLMASMQTREHATCTHVHVSSDTVVQALLVCRLLQILAGNVGVRQC